MSKFDDKDLIMFACMDFISCNSNMDEDDVYKLLSEEQKERFEKFMNLAEENIGDADEVINNRLIEILKTL